MKRKLDIVTHRGVLDKIHLIFKILFALDPMYSKGHLQTGNLINRTSGLDFCSGVEKLLR